MINKSKLVQGVGVNDSMHPVTVHVDGLQVWICPAYQAWKNMLKRCYNTKFKLSRPTYNDVRVCDEWLRFSSFRIWWESNKIDGFDIDKDIIGGGLVYGPESCIFVPRWMNAFITDRSAARGGLPIGVSAGNRNGTFVAKCGNPRSKTQEYIGTFETQWKAHAAWMNRKIEIATELKGEMDEIDVRIYPSIIEIIYSKK